MGGHAKITRRDVALIFFLGLLNMISRQDLCVRVMLHKLHIISLSMSRSIMSMFNDVLRGHCTVIATFWTTSYNFVQVLARLVNNILTAGLYGCCPHYFRK